MIYKSIYESTVINTYNIIAFKTCFKLHKKTMKSGISTTLANKSSRKKYGYSKKSVQRHQYIKNID